MPRMGTVENRVKMALIARTHSSNFKAPAKRKVDWEGQERQKGFVGTGIGIGIRDRDGTETRLRTTVRNDLVLLLLPL